MTIQLKIGNLTRAAKQAGVSSERLRRFVRENSYAERAGRGWRVTDSRLPQMRTLSEGQQKLLVLRDRDQASINGTFMNAAKKFTRSNKYDVIRPFIGKSIMDMRELLPSLLIIHPVNTTAAAQNSTRSTSVVPDKSRARLLGMKR